MNEQKGTLIFIYNAKDSFYNKLTDFAHKAISPSTYNCDLCNLTHGTFKAKADWRDFLANIPFKYEFFYKDNLGPDIDKEQVHPPVIFFRSYNGTLIEVVSNQKLSQISSSRELIEVLSKVLTRY
jgi:hypothetical protein